MRNQNRAVLERLFRDGAIRVHRGRLFDTPARPRTCAFDRVRGMLLGLAVGDALGAPTEGLTPGQRRVRHGDVRDYLPGRHAPPAAVSAARAASAAAAEGAATPPGGGGPAPVPGFPTDDTQLAFWMLEECLEVGAFDPEAVARRFASGPIVGVGSSVATFVHRMEVGMPWAACAAQSAGNGALMRIAPVLVPHLRKGGRALWTDAALCARITHDDTASLSAGLAFVHLLWELLDRAAPPPSPDWWIQRYVEVAGPLEMPAAYRPRFGRFRDFTGRLSDFVGQVLPQALAGGWDVADGSDAWGSGPYLLETVPTALLCLARHGHDPEEALVRAVTDSVDSDTVGAIVGAAVGALHGARALPARWREGLSGRLSHEDVDDGLVFRLVDAAEWRWG